MAAHTGWATQGNTRRRVVVAELPTRIDQQHRWAMPDAVHVILRIFIALFIAVPGIVLLAGAVFFAARDIGLFDRNPL